MTKKLVNIIGINNNEGIHVENPEDVFATLFTESNNEPFLQNTWAQFWRFTTLLFIALIVLRILFEKNV